jgi:hypothetical protein
MGQKDADRLNSHKNCWFESVNWPYMLLSEQI